MSTLATYKTRLTEKIAQSSTAFHTNETRVNAINEAISNMAEAYDIPDLIKKAPITFASGQADKPTDYFRMVKLFLTDDVEREFTYLIEDLFDVQDANSAEDYWTEDFVISTGTRRLLVVPNTETDFTARYVRIPTVLTNDADESGIDYHFDDVVAYWSASILLRNEGTASLGKSQEMERKARETCVIAIGSKRKRGGVKQGERLRSRFEKYPLLFNQRIL